jgi:hypothetical protein
MRKVIILSVLVLVSHGKGWCQKIDTLNIIDANNQKQGWWKIFPITNDFDRFVIGYYKNDRKQSEWKFYDHGRMIGIDYFNDGWWYKSVNFLKGIFVVSSVLNATRDTVTNYEYYSPTEISRKYVSIGINDSNYSVNKVLGGEYVGEFVVYEEKYDYQPFKHIKPRRILKIELYSGKHMAGSAYPPLREIIYYKINREKRSLLVELDNNGKLISGDIKSYQNMDKKELKYLNKRAKKYGNKNSSNPAE